MDRRTASLALVLTAFNFTAVHAKSLKNKAVANKQPLSPRPIYLTMDDGYRHIETVIAELRETPIPVTFFPTGQALLQNRVAWQTLASAGHEFGCHTFSHPACSELTERQFREELARFNSAACNVLGKEAAGKIKYFRFPFGDTGKQLQPLFKKIVEVEFGWHIIGWDLSLSDVFPPKTAKNHSPIELAAEFSKRVCAQDVLLMHFVHPDYLSIAELFEHATRLKLEFRRLGQHPDLTHCGAVGRAPAKHAKA